MGVQTFNESDFYFEDLAAPAAHISNTRLPNNR